MNLSELLVATDITIQRNAQRGLVTVRPTDPSDPQWPAHVASFTFADEEAAGLWHVMSGGLA